MKKQLLVILATAVWMPMIAAIVFAAQPAIRLAASAGTEQARLSAFADNSWFVVVHSGVDDDADVYEYCIDLIEHLRAWEAFNILSEKYSPSECIMIITRAFSINAQPYQSTYGEQEGSLPVAPGGQGGASGAVGGEGGRFNWKKSMYEIELYRYCDKLLSLGSSKKLPDADHYSPSDCRRFSVFQFHGLDRKGRQDSHGYSAKPRKGPDGPGIVGGRGGEGGEEGRGVGAGSGGAGGAGIAGGIGGKGGAGGSTD